MQKIHGDALRGHLDSLILSILERGPAHGLEVLRRLKEAGCGALDLKEGTLYPALYRLEAAGQLAAAWDDEPKQGRGPRRRIYRLTTQGKRQLQAGRREWVEFTRVIGGILGAST